MLREKPGDRCPEFQWPTAFPESILFRSQTILLNFQNYSIFLNLTPLNWGGGGGYTCPNCSFLFFVFISFEEKSCNRHYCRLRRWNRKNTRCQVTRNSPAASRPGYPLKSLRVSFLQPLWGKCGIKQHRVTLAGGGCKVSSRSRRANVIYSAGIPLAKERMYFAADCLEDILFPEVWGPHRNPWRILFLSSLWSASREKCSLAFLSRAAISGDRRHDLL